MDDLSTISRPESDTGEGAAPDRLSFVDCDVHPLFPLTEIYKRMSARSLRHVTTSKHAGGTIREHNRNLHPSGPLRLDAVPPGGGHPGSDPEFMKVDLLDRYGVTAGLMSPVQASSVIPWGSDEAGWEFLSALNDYFLEEWHARDPRFRALISVSPHDPEAAVREVERLADRPGVAGINIPLAEVSPGRSSMMRLYEAAAHHRLPICCHPTGTEGNFQSGPAFAGGTVRTYPEHHGMLGQSGQAAVAALALSGALARLPDLRFVFAEFGFSWVAPMLWRMDTAWERAGGPDGVINRRPSEYVIEQVRFTTQPYDEPDKRRDLQPLLEGMHAEKTLLFSSDYPHWDADDPVVVLKTRLPAHLYKRVTSESAIETFGDRLWN